MAKVISVDDFVKALDRPFKAADTKVKSPCTSEDGGETGWWQSATSAIGATGLTPLDPRGVCHGQHLRRRDRHRRDRDPHPRPAELGRLQSLDIDFRKLLVRLKARPDAPIPVDPSSIKIRDTQLDGGSSITAPTTASLTADRNRLRDGSRITIHEPGTSPAPPERPEDRDA